MKIISLMDEGKAFLPDVSALDVYGDYMLIRDKRDVLYLFTRDGQCISKSKDKFGHGPGEYSIITAYTFNPYSNCIEIVTPKDLLFFDTDFKLKKKVPVPTKFSKNRNGIVFYGKMFDLDSHTHLLIPTSVSAEPHRICVFDSEREEILKTISYDEDVLADITMQSSCFYPYKNDSLLFYPPCVTNYVYTFNKETLSLDKTYFVDFGADGLKSSDISQYANNEARLKKYLLKCDKAMPAKVFYVNNRLVFLIKNGNSIRKWHTIVYDMNTSSMSKISNFDGNEMRFPIIYSCWGNSMFAAVEAGRISSLLNPFGDNVETSGLDNGCDENDFVIIEYEM